uniref:Delta-like protein n=1 Tax=Trichuris muris TaxID=70415 RepID=A0A5S6QXQ2_TRIMR
MQALLLPVVGCCILLIMAPTGRSMGTLEFRINSFQNYDALDADGVCCKATAGPSSTKSACSVSCNLVFRVCLETERTNPQANPSCTLGGWVMGAVGSTSEHLSLLRQSDRVTATSSVMKHAVRYRWPGKLIMTVEIWHQPNGSSTSQDVGAPRADYAITAGRQLLLRVAERKSLPVGGRWNVEEYRNAHSRLRLQLRFVCAEHYYGSQCETFCSARNDSGGHYSCAKDGAKICMLGWQGPKCKDAVCKQGCKHGTCERPGDCVCLSGYAGSDCDVCKRYPGCMHGTCAKPFECTCLKGWGGVFCNQDLNFCVNKKPCQNGGVCSNSGSGSYTCACAPGYSGTNCELKVETCQMNPCQNGGTCHESGANYTCACAANFSGRHCQSNARTCKEQPCENGALCVDAPSPDVGYRCLCKAGWEGTNCDIQRDECHSEPCMNGGSCVSEFGGFHCVCPVGFAGDRCESNVDDCPENACLNGGTCQDEVNNFRCHCPQGFMGTLCQTNIDDCLKRPCLNGGTCVDLVNDFACVCPPGYKGKDCSVRLGGCEANPCRNGGTCRNVHHRDYVCQCAPCFGGRNCHIRGEQCPWNGTLKPYITGAPVAISDGGHQLVDELRTSVGEIPMLVGAPLGGALLLLLAIVLFVACVMYRKAKGNSSAAGSSVIKNNLRAYHQQSHWNDWSLSKENAGKGYTVSKGVHFAYDSPYLALEAKSIPDEKEEADKGKLFVASVDQTSAKPYRVKQGRNINQYETFVGVHPLKGTRRRQETDDPPKQQHGNCAEDDDDDDPYHGNHRHHHGFGSELEPDDKSSPMSKSTACAVPVPPKKPAPVLPAAGDRPLTHYCNVGAQRLPAVSRGDTATYESQLHTEPCDTNRVSQV